MSLDIHQRNKQLINKYRAALYDCEPSALLSQLQEVFAPNSQIHLAFPFEDLDGPGGLFETAFRPLIAAVPDLERRDYIVMGGTDKDQHWVGCGGFYTGVFKMPWLAIPPTQHAVFMRFHEFFRIEDGQVVEMQALWDIPELMMQADAWPMSPGLGVEWLIPGPARQDGILTGPYNPQEADTSVQLVLDMVAALMRSPEGDEVLERELRRYWHPKMLWYGPAGIGSTRRFSGFRRWHQIPFLRAMPDRVAMVDQGALFGDGDYVGFTAWPGMRVTLTGDGWLGIPPTNQELTMRSLDFWRHENGLLRENWVLLDMLSIYDQLGVDVLARMREITVARQ